MEENKQIRIPLREDYRNGDLLRGRDVNKITHRVNELTGDIDKIDIDLSGKLDTSAYTEDKAAIESRIDGVAEGLSANTTAITQLQTSKQDKLTAGSGITIENNVISAQQPDLSDYATTGYVDTRIEEAAISGGNNITITENIANAEGYLHNEKVELYLKDAVSASTQHSSQNIDTCAIRTYRGTPTRIPLCIAGGGNRSETYNNVFIGYANRVFGTDKPNVELDRLEGRNLILGCVNEIRPTDTTTAFQVPNNNFVVGGNNFVYGSRDVVVGDFNHAYGYQGVIAGEQLRTYNAYESAFGTNNVSHRHLADPSSYLKYGDITVFSIGVGTDTPDDGRNAVEVMRNADVYIYGIGGYNGVDINTYTESGVCETLQDVILRIETDLAGKQGQLTAGSGITIINGVISAIQPDLSPYALSADVATELSTKVDTSAYTQDKAAIQASIDEKVATTAFTAYTASTNDTLQGHGGRLDGHDTKIGNLEDNKLDSSAYTEDRAALVTVIDRKAESSALTAYTASTQETLTGITNSITNLQNGKQNKLTAGTNITIVNDVISAQQPDLSPYALSADVATELSKKVDTTAYTQDKAAIEASISANTTAITQLQQSKQNNLSAGTGIQIQNDVISLTGAGGAQIDDTVTGTTTTWSSQKIMEEMRITLTNLLPNGNVLAL